MHEPRGWPPPRIASSSLKPVLTKTLPAVHALVPFAAANANREDADAVVDRSVASVAAAAAEPALRRRKVEAI